jgi:hypothetical protein
LPITYAACTFGAKPAKPPARLKGEVVVVVVTVVVDVVDVVDVVVREAFALQGRACLDSSSSSSLVAVLLRS